MINFLSLFNRALYDNFRSKAGVNVVYNSSTSSWTDTEGNNLLAQYWDVNQPNSTTGNCVVTGTSNGHSRGLWESASCDTDVIPLCVVKKSFVGEYQ